MTTLDRYVIREVMISLFGALAVLLLALVGASLFEVLAPLLAKGANPLIVGQYLAFRVPWALAFGLPLAFLFAMLLVLSRLGEDSELKAMLAGGVQARRMLMPMLLISSVLFVLALVANETLVPRSLQLGQSRLRDAVFDQPRALLTPGKVFADRFGRKLYVGKIDEQGSLGQLRIIANNEVIQAEQGRFENGQLKLDQGQRITYNGSTVRTITTFKSATVPLADIGYDPPSPLANLSVSELWARIKQYKSQNIAYHAELTALMRKFAEPASVFSFAAFAVGLAFYLISTRGNLGLVGVVVITFIYYATWSVGRIMGEQGALHPFVAAWGPNILYTAAAMVLLWRKR